MKAAVFAAFAALLLAGAAHAEGWKNTRYKEPGKPNMFPPNYGYRYQEPKATPYRNPYAPSKRELARDDRTRGLGISPPRKTDILGTPREPLGGEWDAPRKRRY